MESVLYADQRRLSLRSSSSVDLATIPSQRKTPTVFGYLETVFPGGSLQDLPDVGSDSVTGTQGAK